MDVATGSMRLAMCRAHSTSGFIGGMASILIDQVGGKKRKFTQCDLSVVSCNLQTEEP